MIEKENTQYLLYIICISAVCWILLFPGIYSPLLLDDLADIAVMSKIPQGTDFLSWFYDGKERVSVLGRPLSALSFFLQRGSLPDHPEHYKLVNLSLHLINGLLVGYLISLVLKYLANLPQHVRFWVATAVATIWFIHPIQHSTVFYIVQRMTQLGTLFTLLGCVSYIKLRERRDFSTLTSTFLMLGIIALFAGVGILAKETALLLFLYVFIIELYLFDPALEQLRYRRLFLLLCVVPYLLFILFILLNWDYLGGMGEVRTFTPVERLMTQARVLMEYLRVIILPDLTYFTLYHDDIEVSRGFLSPISTLMSAIGFLALIVTLLAFRKREQLLSFGLAWFFVGHLMESTFVPLELVFEHRNYIPSIGPLLCVVWLLGKLLPRWRLGVLAVYSLIVITLSVINVRTWALNDGVVVQWAMHHPTSFRAQYSLALYQSRAGLFDDASETMAGYIEQKPLHVNARLTKLVYDCVRGADTREQIDNAIEVIEVGNLGVAISIVVADVINIHEKGGCVSVNRNDLMRLVRSFLERDELKYDKNMRSHFHYMLAILAAKEKLLDPTIEHIKKSNELAPNFVKMTFEVEVFLTAGLFEEASRSFSTLVIWMTSQSSSSPAQLTKLKKLKHHIDQKKILAFDVPKAVDGG